MKKKVFGYTKIEGTVPIHGVLCNVIRRGIPTIVFWDDLSKKWRRGLDLMPLDWEPKPNEWAVWPKFPPIHQEEDL